MAECLTPFLVKNKREEDIPVPCGKCPECLKRRVSNWSFRLLQHGKTVISSHFVTLTYDTKTVPISEKGYMNLSKRDLQLFFKRLRKARGKNYNDLYPLKYYAAGEYGTTTMRPHYHIILFNATEQQIRDAWQLGNIHYGIVTEASIGYTLKYLDKPKKIPLHKNDDRQPEFALMSKKLGINYLTPQMIAWHQADILNRMYVNLPGNKKASMPRYYKQKIYDTDILPTINAHVIKLRNAKIAEEQQKNPNYQQQQEDLKLHKFRQAEQKQLKRNKI